MRNTGFVDIHVHPSFKGTGKAEIEAFCQRYGLSRAWLLSLECAPDGSRDEVGDLNEPVLNAEVLDLLKERREGFVGGFTLPPGRLPTRQLVEKHIRLGFQVCGELKVPGLRFDSRACRSLFDILEALSVPVLFHIGRAGFSETSLPEFRRMFRRYPGLVFIAHSMGWWKYLSRSWEADLDCDYPASKLVPTGPAEELLSEYPNLMANLDMIEGLHALTRDPEYGMSFLSRFKDRLMYGSDFPCEVHLPATFQVYANWRDCVMLGTPHLRQLPEGYRQIAEYLLEEPSVREAVLGGNATRLIDSLPGQHSPCG
jgi:predicted TIM-barrel fold metal-dependent hydrolase